MRMNNRRGERGFTLIEVLVTIVIIVFGLLGLVGLQAKASKVEFESYQRGQALSLVRDMETRIQASRAIVVAGFLNGAVSSTDGTVFMGNGTGASNFVDVDGNCVPAAAGLDAAKYEACLWAQALQGAAAKEGTANVGAMVGARGCLMRVVPPENNALADIYIVVVWQGFQPGSEPAADSPAGQCASGVDFGAGLRRGVSLRVMVPDLKKAT